MRNSAHVWLLLVDTRAGGVHTAVCNRWRDDRDSLCHGCTSKNSLDLYIDARVEKPTHETFYPSNNSPFIRGTVPPYPHRVDFSWPTDRRFTKEELLYRGRYSWYRPERFLLWRKLYGRASLWCIIVVETLVGSKSNSDNETDGEELVFAQSDADLNKVPQLLGEDLTQFEQSTSILINNFFVKDSYFLGKYIKKFRV